MYRDLAQGISAEDRERAFAIVEQIRTDVEAAAEPSKPDPPANGGGNEGSGNGGGGTGNGSGTGGGNGGQNP